MAINNTEICRGVVDKAFSTRLKDPHKRIVVRNSQANK